METSVWVFGVVGLLLGGALAWAVATARLRGPLAAAEERARSVDELNQRIAQREQRLDELQRTLAEEQRARTAAETRAAEQAKMAETTRQDAETATQALVEQARLRFEAMFDERCKALEQEKAHLAQREAETRQFLAEAKEKLAEHFRSASIESLEIAQKNFLKLAETRLNETQKEAVTDLTHRQKAIDELVKPISEQLQKLRESQATGEERMNERIQLLTGNIDILNNALRKPHSRGAWGEMHLEIAAQQAGLIENVHYTLQDSTVDEEGSRRADMVMMLPHGRRIVIDCKVPLTAFWEAMNTGDEAVRDQRLVDHARCVRQHIKQLSSKEYAKRYAGALDYVFLYLPTEAMYHAALEKDPSILGDSHSSRVILIGPTTLLAIYSAVAYIVNQERLSRDTEKIRDLGNKLYESIVSFHEHFEKVGRGLSTAVSAYNSAIGNLESRLVPRSRELKDASGATKALVETPAKIEHVVRAASRKELMGSTDAPQLDLIETTFVEVDS